MSKSAIEWTDEGWPVVTGCTKENEGCRYCYAARLAATRLKHHPHYKGLAYLDQNYNNVSQWTGVVRLNEGELAKPSTWKKPRNVFVCHTADLFHPRVPFDYILRVWLQMAACPQHTFQILTKRYERLCLFLVEWLPPAWALATTTLQLLDRPLPNVQIGVTVVDQRTANEAREYLRAVPAAYKFVSYEPALEPIDWAGWEFVNRIISGGETGPHARAAHPDCHRLTRDFCIEHGIEYFFKAWGAWFPRSQWGHNPDLVLPDDDRVERDPHSRIVDDEVLHCVGKRRAGRLLDGREWNGETE